MSVLTWVGTTSSVFATDTNWAEIDTPETNDEVYIPSGEVDIAGADHAAIDLDVFNVGPENQSRIGSSGNPLIIAADLMTISGGKEMFITAGTAGIDLLIINTGKTDDSQTITLSGSIGKLIANSSNIVLAAGCTVGELDAESIANVVLDGGDVTDAYGNLGNISVINSASQIGTLHNTRANTVVSSGGITNIYQVGSGRVTYNSTSTITKLRAMDGEFARSDNRPLTITEAVFHSTAKADLRYRGVTITTSYHIGPPGTIFMPLGTETMSV